MEKREPLGLSVTGGRMRVAVVGSGIAGLSAAWLLSNRFQVTLYEKRARLGMDADSVVLPGTTTRVDVPLRVFYQGYYPNVSGLYRHIGVQFENVDYSASFGPVNGETSFRYSNVVKGQLSLPYVGLRHLSKPRLVADMLRFFATARHQVAKESTADQTLAEHLERNHYSAAFIREFLYPALAGIGTCSYAAVAEYPARVVLGYYAHNLFFGGVRRAVQGAADVVRRLSIPVGQVRTGAGVTSLREDADGIAVIDEMGHEDTFDHVILAAQANQSQRILGDGFAIERDILRRFPYEASDVLVHTDTDLAPRNRRNWSPVNFLWEPGLDRPMATIWMNAVQPEVGDEPVFQTWNPLLEVAPDRVIAQARFERPVVNSDTVEALGALEALHRQPDRRLWFIGSYARYGVPLLESATTSGVDVAERLGCERPWSMPT